MTTRIATKPKTTAEWLFQALRDDIIRGSYPAGEPIRQEEVAARYDVSRMPVREAMRRLEAEGLVIQRPHRGVVVAELDAEDALELFEIRAALEVLAVARSFPNLTDEQVKDIERAHVAMQKSSKKTVLQRHRDFHMSLYAAAGTRLQKLLVDQFDSSQRYHLRFGRPEMEVSQQDMEEHEALVRAARERDVGAATRIIQAHVGDGGVAIARSIAERQGGRAPD